ncbi:MAG: hypothetical protein IPM14_11755 [bacterium]|nr:hypothetical protein [bacterium]
MINEIKSRFIMKIFLLSILFLSSTLAQQFSAVNIKGDVKYRTAISEEWNVLKEEFSLEPTDFVITGERSSVQIKRAEQIFSLGELSAVALSSIKLMSTDELLLALAMEDMINAPKTNGKNNSSNTAVYGDKEGEGKNLDLKDDNFGIKRLNGAVQLAKNGFKESSIVFAKETYRKYPDSKQIPSFRIFFADLLYEKELYEEALREYMDIRKLELTGEEKKEVAKKIDSINKILLNN